MSEAAMEALIETCNNDIRQIINQLQMRRLTKQTFEFDDVKSLQRRTSTWVRSPRWISSQTAMRACSLSLSG